MTTWCMLGAAELGAGYLVVRYVRELTARHAGFSSLAARKEHRRWERVAAAQLTERKRSRLRKAQARHDAIAEAVGLRELSSRNRAWATEADEPFITAWEDAARYRGPAARATYEHPADYYRLTDYEHAVECLEALALARLDGPAQQTATPGE